MVSSSPRETSSSGMQPKGTWQSIKDFFSGESDTNDRDYQTSDWHQGMDWSEERSTYYNRGISSGGAVLSIYAEGSRLDRARSILERNGGDLRESGFESDYNVSGTQTGTTTAYAGRDRDIDVNLRDRDVSTRDRDWVQGSEFSYAARCCAPTRNG